MDPRQQAQEPLIGNEEILTPYIVNEHSSILIKNSSYDNDPLNAFNEENDDTQYYTKTKDHNTLLTALSFVVMLTLIFTELYHPAVIMLATIGFLISAKVIKPSDGFQGFSDESFFTIVVSYILSSAIIKNRSLEFVTRNLFRDIPNKISVITIISTFIDNTPVVLIGVSLVMTWKKTSGIPLSKVLLPISFAGILGGMNSILGNSSFTKAHTLLTTKLTLLKQKRIFIDAEIPYFEICSISLLIVIPSLLYITFATKLLPNKKDKNVHNTNKDYYFSFRVTKNSRFVGHYLGNTVLIKPPCGILKNIRRGASYEDVTEDLIIQENDILSYIAPSSILNDVLTYNGIIPLDESIDDVSKCKVYEVSLNPSDPLIGQPIDSLFERRVSVIGISINDSNLEEQLQTIDLLSATSTYILLAKNESEMDDNTFHIITDIGIQLPSPTTTLKTIVPLLCLIIPCLLQVLNISTLSITGFVSVLVLLLCKCMTVKEIYNSIDVEVLGIVAASFGITAAIDKSGLGMALALTTTKWLYGFGKFGILLGIFIPTILLAQPLANTVIVEIMFPVVWNLYYGLNDNSIHGNVIGIKSAMYTMMIASSSSFLLAIGYPTHLIVCRHANYSMKEFFIFGLPVFLWICCVGVLAPYLFFELHSN
ncbi:Sodium/sulfate symporter [Entamoeba marina]